MNHTVSGVILIELPSQSAVIPTGSLLETPSKVNGCIVYILYAARIYKIRQNI